MGAVHGDIYGNALMTLFYCCCKRMECEDYGGSSGTQRLNPSTFAEYVSGCINAFKSVRHLHMTATSDELFEPHAFNEVFFASLAHRGITCFDAKLDLNQAGILEINAGTAFAYVFAEPMNGVSRELRGVKFVEKDILELIRKVCGLRVAHCDK